MTEDADRAAIFEAALAIAAQGSWRHCRLSDISARTGVAVADLERDYGDRTGVLRAFARDIDRRALAGLDEAVSDPGLPVRERLLEILLVRFDAMAPHRTGIAALLRALPAEPALALGGLRALHAAMDASLAAAGVPQRGLSGQVRSKGLAVIFLDALRVWAGDDSADLSATTRCLDERLRQAESLIRSLGAAGPAPDRFAD